MGAEWVLAALMAAQLAVPAGQIRILDAVYGDAARGRLCDATLAVEQQCDERESCLISVTNGICGDPAYGLAKRLHVAFKCGRAPAQLLVAAEGSVIRLSCAAQAARPGS
ncbi:SUEL-type lectin domain-containing protein [Limobrevibacterium gyesilva]|uniref:SUEL-type lectin domain-containing protein n=1 Tax=Limobrevibacterium gyesilva TaxID=2991712 RepID=A0AA42CK16_9PROT|nr:SUEL-type lectin domain-containing protein [Limobrevibacterium gyesilva]MCW3477452.1 SUEL-type lectin domain-containing protein [Limobrevibacterium gyesilva]